MQPPVVLDWYLGYLHRWLLDLGVPEWDDILLTEDVVWDAQSRRIVQLGELHTADDYRGRFTDLATRGWPWINLHALGLLNGRLILSIELPAYEPTGASPTSVNISGPSNWVKEHGYSLDGLVDSGPAESG